MKGETGFCLVCVPAMTLIEKAGLKVKIIKPTFIDGFPAPTHGVFPVKMVILPHGILVSRSLLGAIFPTKRC